MISRWLTNAPLRLKLTWMSVITSSCVVAGSLVIAVAAGAYAYQRAARASIAAIADAVGQNAASAVLFLDPRAAEEILHGLRADPRIIAAYLLTNKNEVFAKFVRADRAQSARKLKIEERRGREYANSEALSEAIRESRTLIDFNGDLVTCRRAVHEGQLVANVLIEAESDLPSIVGFLGLGVLVLLPLAGLISYRLSAKLQKIISEPVSGLLSTMQTVAADRDYSRRFPRNSQDEVGELIDGFNHMLAQIEERDSLLEQRVEERTALLSKTNTKLQHTVEDLERARDVAEAASRTKSQFLANMSHEIRTPMNGVLGMLELLQGSGLGHRQKRFADAARRSAEQLLSILNDILDFSKIEAGKLNLESVDFDLREVIEDALDLFSESAHSKGIEVVSSLPPDFPSPLRGDPTRLRQVISNLLGNAVKFTHEGEIAVTLSVDGVSDEAVCVRVEVRDTGIGISPESQRGIFESFAQADGSTTRKYGGTGLGLAISKQLVQMMAGDIGVKSEPGKGSTFWFTAFLGRLPSSEQTGRPALDAEGMRVLVVDDNATNREVLRNQLEGWRVACHAVESGEQALEALEEARSLGRPYTLAILDYLMPNMDGLDLAQALRERPHLSPLPLVMLTSVGTPGDARLQELGIQFCLAKPARRSFLFDALAAAARGGTKAEPKRAEPSPGPVPLPAARILLAEDNPVNREVALGMLAEFGQLLIDTAANGVEALAALAENAYDLVLMDCQMPEMDGYEATRALRRREAEAPAEPRRLPVIALTANVMEGDREKCLEAGMDDHLGKPIRRSELLEAIRRWLADGRAGLPSTSEPAATTLAPQTPPLDLEALDAIRSLEKSGADGLLRKVVEAYLESSPPLLEALAAAVASCDAEALRSAAHALKSSSANVGACRLSDLCRDLESRGRAGNLDGVETLADTAAAEHVRVAAALTEKVNPLEREESS